MGRERDGGHVSILPRSYRDFYYATEIEDDIALSRFSQTPEPPRREPTAGSFNQIIDQAANSAVHFCSLLCEPGTSPKSDLWMHVRNTSAPSDPTSGAEAVGHVPSLDQLGWPKPLASHGMPWPCQQDGPTNSSGHSGLLAPNLLACLGQPADRTWTDHSSGWRQGRKP